MKRFMTLALAAMLCLSLASVASAAIGDIGYVVNVLGSPLAVNDEGRIVASAGKYYTGGIPYGATIYYPILGAPKGSESGNKISDMGETINYWVSDSELVKSVSFKKSWDEGASAIKSVTIENKKIEWDSEGQYADDKLMQYLVPPTQEAYNNRYYRFVAVTLNDKASTSGTDIYGSLTLRKTGTNAFWGNGTKGNTSITFDINLEAGYPYAEDTMLGSDLKIYNFSDSGSYALGTSDEETITLNGDAGHFVVATKGQGKTLISCNLDYNTKVSEKFPRANLSFVNCNGAQFKRSGDLYLYADAGTYLYEVNANGTVSKVSAKYDENEGAFKLKTNKLGAYVISDMTLTTSSASSDEDLEGEDITADDSSSTVPGGDIIVIDPGMSVTPPPSTNGPIIVNPGTGARL